MAGAELQVALKSHGRNKKVGGTNLLTVTQNSVSLNFKFHHKYPLVASKRMETN